MKMLINHEGQDLMIDVTVTREFENKTDAFLNMLCARLYDAMKYNEEQGFEYLAGSIRAFRDQVRARLKANDFYSNKD